MMPLRVPLQNQQIQKSYAMNTSHDMSYPDEYSNYNDAPYPNYNQYGPQNPRGSQSMREPQQMGGAPNYSHQMATPKAKAANPPSTKPHKPKTFQDTLDGLFKGFKRPHFERILINFGTGVIQDPKYKYPTNVVRTTKY